MHNGCPPAGKEEGEVMEKVNGKESVHVHTHVHIHVCMIRLDLLSYMSCINLHCLVSLDSLEHPSV